MACVVKEIWMKGVLAGALYKTDDGMMAEVYAVNKRLGASLELLGFTQDPNDPDIYWMKNKETDKND